MRLSKNPSFRSVAQFSASLGRLLRCKFAAGSLLFLDQRGCILRSYQILAETWPEQKQPAGTPIPVRSSSIFPLIEHLPVLPQGRRCEVRSSLEVKAYADLS